MQSPIHRGQTWLLAWLLLSLFSATAWAQVPELPDATVPAIAAPAPEYPTFQPSLRLMTGFERSSEARFASGGNLENERYGFFLNQARAELEGQLTKRISLEVSADLGDAYDADTIDTGNAPPYLRDAFVNLRLKRWFRITAGHFKRPMSALELRSSGKLEVRGRGITNELVVEDNSWGGRGLGMQLWGKLDFLETNWAVGVFDPAWAPRAANRPKGADALARLTVEPVTGLTLGANGGTKTLDTPPYDEYHTYYALGADLKLEVLGLSFLADAVWAQLPQVAAGLEHQSALGVVGLVSYDISLSGVLTLQPVLLGEYADASTDHARSSTVRGVAGVNWLVHDTLRIMPQFELVRWLGEPSELSPSEGTNLYLMLSLAI